VDQHSVRHTQDQQKWSVRQIQWHELQAGMLALRQRRAAAAAARSSASHCLLLLFLDDLPLLSLLLTAQPVSRGESRSDLSVERRHDRGMSHVRAAASAGERHLRQARATRAQAEPHRGRRRTDKKIRSSGCPWRRPACLVSCDQAQQAAAPGWQAGKEGGGCNDGQFELRVCPRFIYPYASIRAMLFDVPKKKKASTDACVHYSRTGCADDRSAVQ